MTWRYGLYGIGMHKLVLDTNVIVSGIISKSYPYQILHELVAEQHVSLLLSPPILAEYRQVLSRDKFSRFPDFKGKADRALTLRDCLKMVI